MSWRKRVAAWIAVCFCLGMAHPTAAFQGDPGDEQYLFVVGLLDKDLVDLGIKEARSFLREHARHPKADLVRYRLASTLFDQGEWKEAHPLFRELWSRQDFEFEAEVSFRLGQCEIQAGAPDKAEEAFTRVLSLDRDYLKSPAAFSLADMALRQGRVERARELYDSILSGAPEAATVADAQLGLTWCAFQDGRYEEVASRGRAFLEAHAQSPRAQEVWFLLGEAQLEAGDCAGAIVSYEQVGEGEWQAPAWRGLGFALAEAKEHVRAAERFGMFLERFPGSPLRGEVALRRGIELLRAGDTSAARSALQSQDVIESGESFYWRAQVALAEALADEALQWIDRGLSADPSTELAERLWRARGDALAALGRSNQALDAYQRAGSVDALYQAAVVELSAGRAEKALELCGHLDNQPERSNLGGSLELLRGEALFSLGRYPEAQEAFLKASGEEGSDSRARSRIAWCRYRTGDYQGAAELFSEIADQSSESSEREEARFMHGSALAEAGQAQAACEAFQRYLSDHPTGTRVARALFELGEALRAIGRSEEAVQQFERVLSEHGGDASVGSAAYALAFILHEQGENERACSVLAATLSDASLEADLRVACAELLVWCETACSDEQGAVEALRAMSGSCQDEVRLWKAAKTVVDACNSAQEFQLASQVLDEHAQAAKEQGTRVAIDLERVFLALERGERDQAVQIVEALLQRGQESPELAEACYFVGKAQLDSGEDERATALFERACTMPGSGVVSASLYMQGFAHLQKERYEEAERCFLAVTGREDAFSWHGESLFLLGECQFHLGRYEEAAANLERVLEQFPTHAVRPKALFRLGLARCELSRWEEAQSVLAELSQRFPDFPNRCQAELARGRALAELNRRREAQQAFQRVLGWDSGELAARARIEMGKLLRSEGDVEGALAEFLKVALLFGHPEEVATALLLSSECLEEMGNSEQARAQLDEILENYPGTRAAQEARVRKGGQQSY